MYTHPKCKERGKFFLTDYRKFRANYYCCEVCLFRNIYAEIPSNPVITHTKQNLLIEKATLLYVHYFPAVNNFCELQCNVRVANTILNTLNWFHLFKFGNLYTFSVKYLFFAQKMPGSHLGLDTVEGFSYFIFDPSKLMYVKQNTRGC